MNAEQRAKLRDDMMLKLKDDIVALGGDPGDAIAILVMAAFQCHASCCVSEGLPLAEAILSAQEFLVWYPAAYEGVAKSMAMLKANPGLGQQQ